MVRTALAASGAVLLAELVVAVAANVGRDYWHITWSTTIFMCLGLCLGRFTPLREALVGVLVAALTSATAGSAIIEALQPWWFPRHAFPLTAMVPFVVLVLTLAGGWAVTIGSAVRPGNPVVRIALAAYAVAVAIDVAAYMLLTGWATAWASVYLLPAAARAAAYAVMGFGLARAGTRSDTAWRTIAGTVAAGELTTIALLLLLFASRALHFVALPTVICAAIVSGAIAAAAYALGRVRSPLGRETVR
jgi:hypothetical protein